MRCAIIPPYILSKLAEAERPDLERARQAARASLALDHPFRVTRRATMSVASLAEGAVQARRRELEDPDRTIYDAGGGTQLPGEPVRSEGDAAGGDTAVNEAYDGLGDTHELYRAAFGRASIDDNNLPLDATVHYGRDYDNAFWDGERMVFGDGDGDVFIRMTASLSVIGHELTHGVTQYTAALEYEGQSGALNESVSDVFGALVEQHSLGQDVSQATWLIGAGIFTAAVQGDALRSMKAPGTAYNDDVLGKDPQPAHMSDYIETTDDNGGVHLNSGIPNRAFYLVADALGGNAWEQAGLIWYDTLTAGALRPDADFAAFAAATESAATARFGDDSTQVAAVRTAWTTVGVEAALP